jgi:hypothetical protein
LISFFPLKKYIYVIKDGQEKNNGYGDGSEQTMCSDLLFVEEDRDKSIGSCD